MEISDKWHLSQISIPPRVDWDIDQDPHLPSQDKYAYYFDDSQGAGQTIYIMEDDIVGTGGVSIPHSLHLQLHGRRLITS